MSTAIDMQDLTQEASRVSGKVLLAYMEASSKVQAAIREMVEILKDPESDEQERAMAFTTIYEALFPSIQVDVEALDRHESRLYPADAQSLKVEESTFSERVLAILQERNMTQADLAEKVGLGQPAISMMLTRQSRPQNRTVRKIARALEVSASQLWPSFQDQATHEAP